MSLDEKNEVNSHQQSDQENHQDELFFPLLKLLKDEGFEITLVYPENELRNEYLDRYIARDSPYDFIGSLMKYWDKFINELKEQKYCKHKVLKTKRLQAYW